MKIYTVETCAHDNFISTGKIYRFVQVVVARSAVTARRLGLERSRRQDKTLFLHHVTCCKVLGTYLGKETEPFVVKTR